MKFIIEKDKLIEVIIDSANAKPNWEAEEMADNILSNATPYKEDKPSAAADLVAELEDFTAGILPTELADDIRNTLENMLSRFKPEAQEPITGTALQAMDMEKELRKNMPDYDTPLAVLAGRKGKTSRIMVLHYNDKWDEFQSEAECREYLLSLPDKGEGK